jgi:hypothetical protein
MDQNWLQFLRSSHLLTYFTSNKFRPIHVLCLAHSKVTKSTIERRLLSSEGINNHKLLHLLLLAASFHLHPRIITLSTLKTHIIFCKWHGLLQINQTNSNIMCNSFIIVRAEYSPHSRETSWVTISLLAIFVHWSSIIHLGRRFRTMLT